jgi:hypothetical protein
MIHVLYLFNVLSILKRIVGSKKEPFYERRYGLGLLGLLGLGLQLRFLDFLQICIFFAKPVFFTTFIEQNQVLSALHCGIFNTSINNFGSTFLNSWASETSELVFDRPTFRSRNAFFIVQKYTILVHF